LRRRRLGGEPLRSEVGVQHAADSWGGAPFLFLAERIAAGRHGEAELLRLVAGLIGRDAAVLTDGRAPFAALRGAVVEHIRLHARGEDKEPETLQVGVPHVIAAPRIGPAASTIRFVTFGIATPSGVLTRGSMSARCQRSRGNQGMGTARRLPGK
jgi:hypothetical protein